MELKPSLKIFVMFSCFNFLEKKRVQFLVRNRFYMAARYGFVARAVRSSGVVAKEALSCHFLLTSTT